MRKAFDFLKLVLAGTALFVVTFLLLSTLGCQDTDILRSSDERYVEEYVQTVDGNGINLLDAQTTNGAIVIRGTVGDEIVVGIKKKVRASSEEEAEKFADRVAVHVERAGNRIRIYVRHPDLPDHVELEVSYDIECPFRLDLQLGTTNGAVLVEEIEGSVFGTTTNGAIEVLAAWGPFNLSSTNGDIEAELRQLTSDGTFSTTNGSIEVKLLSGSGNLTATTTNGAVEMELPEDFSGELDASTTNGRARANFQVPFSSGDPPTRIWGSIGNGGAARIRLRTINGNVTVEKP